MNFDPRKHAIDEHKRWMGYLQPEGVVVSAVALVDHGVQLDASTFISTQERFLAAVSKDPDTGAPLISHFAQFARTFLGWRDDLLDIFAVEAEVPDSLRVSTGEFGELLHPDAALRLLAPAEGAPPWLLLVRQLPPGTSLDAVPETQRATGWVASPAQKFERLLRGTSVPIGLIANGTEVRLIYAPRGENAGSLTFPVRFMTELAGRAVTSAFEMLLSHRRLISVAEASRLPALLKKSRDYQSAVSTQLSEQVLHSLYELLRGFQAADQQVGGKLLRDVLARNPDEVYHGLLNLLLRLVFLLFAEDRSVMPAGRLYQNNYSVHGLFERLRAANERYPDTMDSRYGAWAQLLALFRLVHAGCKHPDLTTPARSGNLFDYDRFPFLEGRANRNQPIGELPLVSDGTIYRVLEKLLILDGERLSYRTLDVEEVGSVYQTIMGFCVEVSAGNAIALKGKRKNGGVPAAPVINLDHLLAVPAKDRNKWLKEHADTELSGEADKALKAAATVLDLLAALDKRIDRQSTPMPVGPGGLVLQPTDERRRSGSHYTPRSFTQPIVRKTLEPILKRFGGQPTPDQILSLKICDIAVGSAAFLVETCRQLADVLVRAWRVHGGRPALPPDETEELLAMRTIAQRCLYGVDRNPMAVDLAKLSLWLATLAKDHPFTFLDHAIRCGDSLVGLTRRQIETFTWKTGFTTGQLWEQEVRKRTAAALRERQNLLGLGDDYGTPQLKREKLEKADELLDLVRFIGDAAVAAFFAADNDKAREAKRAELADRISEYLRTMEMKLRPSAEVNHLRSGQYPVRPFHWEIESPEVFARENPGFDGIVGNPPFLGGNKISEYFVGPEYGHWLKFRISESKGQVDLCVFFFCRAFALLRDGGSMGLIATSGISEGDSRVAGLGTITKQGGQIFAASTAVTWPGAAAVLVCQIHICKGDPGGITRQLNLTNCIHINSRLQPRSELPDALALTRNTGKCFKGTSPGGDGFVLTLEETQHLVEKDPHNAEVIKLLVGGDEVVAPPGEQQNRRIISFGKMRLEEAERWPAVLEIVKARILPYRLTGRDHGPGLHGKKYWWQHVLRADPLYDAIESLGRCLVTPEVSTHHAVRFENTSALFLKTVYVFAWDSYCAFSLLQCRSHEIWSREHSSKLGVASRYSVSNAFETFPFPAGFETNAALEAAGREYYEFRAALMQDLWLGLTEIYNLFHSPDDEALARLEALYRKRAATPDWRTAESVPADRTPLTLYATPATALAGVRRLRELHAAMDAAVLTAFGWTDLLPQCRCEFLLDYEDDDSESAEESGGRKKKKPWRYRWPDEVRDEVLARLLKENALRAEEERITASRAATVSSAPTKPKGKKRALMPSPDTLDLNLS
ncbi:MAG: class I SAM-dependent DNA methyltransferase [Acidobacteria bacterium]|nr:class I SAM-dependent DNA methyltransferase [Acidobacteriota bacterium]